MGTYTSYNGMFAVEPSLTWPEIQQSEAWSGHPDYWSGEGRYKTRYGAALIISTESVETPEGQLHRHTSALVDIVGDELDHATVMHTLRKLAGLFGATHRFVGTLECRHDHPDVKTPFRVRIVGTAVEEVWPVMFWPDSQEVYDRVRVVVDQHAGVEPDDADDITAKVLHILARNYAKER